MLIDGRVVPAVPAAALGELAGIAISLSGPAITAASAARISRRSRAGTRRIDQRVARDSTNPIVDLGQRGGPIAVLLARSQ
jgi:hypothetical protein